MSTRKIIYWITTTIFSLWMLMNAFAYLGSEKAAQLSRHLGFPDYFRIELAIAKLIGVALLMFPFIKGRIKEWAYAGFTITVFSGFIAHVCSGDPLPSSSSALIALAILLTSYWSYHHKI